MTQYKQLPTELTKHQFITLRHELEKEGYHYTISAIKIFYSKIIEMFPTLNPVDSEYKEVTEYINDLNDRLAHVESLLTSKDVPCNCEECTEEPVDPELAKLVSLLENQGFEIIRVK